MNARRTALITGIAGQDGSYLAEQLLARGYRVCGVVRSRSAPSYERILHLRDSVELVEGDVTEEPVLDTALGSWLPDEVYHLAAESSVSASWGDPAAMVARSRTACTNLIQAVRRHRPDARVVLASSSEVFGLPAVTPQDEATPLAPTSPYGEAKAHLVTVARDLRREEDLHASCAILYNHESPRRSSLFVTRKVTQAVAAIAAGRATELRLGNLDARRDWGAAEEYTDALWRIAQCDAPGDYVIGTGRSRSVRDLCDIAFRAVGLEAGRYVVSDAALMRPVDALTLVANAARARSDLGWIARRTLEDIVTEMVEADVARLAGSPA